MIHPDAYMMALFDFKIFFAAEKNSKIIGRIWSPVIYKSMKNQVLLRQKTPNGFMKTLNGHEIYRIFMCAAVSPRINIRNHPKLPKANPIELRVSKRLSSKYLFCNAG